MARKRTVSVDLPTAAPDPNARHCEWPGCDDVGEHRAPRSPQELNHYRWFCLVHVRAYNSSWNYYAGMSENEVEADVRRDTVWRRPSWPLGSVRPGFGPDGLADPFGLFSDGEAPKAPPRPATPENEALTVLDLRPPLTQQTVKARYKELVKLHHPDANGGDQASEEKIKRINEAYATIMNSFGP
jgi:DnaJ-domain-containing protein 1